MSLSLSEPEILLKSVRKPSREIAHLVGAALVHTIEIEAHGAQGQMVGEQIVHLRQDIDPSGPGIILLP